MGIANANVHKDVKTMYDLEKSIQKGVATAENHGSWSVWHDGDILHLGDEPVAKVVILEDEAGERSEH